MSTYNGAPYLAEQIDSVLGQSYPSLRLIVRDDGSRDGTAVLLQRWSDDPRVNIRLRENVGLPAAFFALLDEADPSVAAVALCDQDDVWLPDKITRAMQFLRDEEGPAMVCARVAVVDEALRPLYLHELPHRGPSFANALVQNIALGCTVVLNRPALDLVQGRWPRECVMHDAWLYLVLAGVGTVRYDVEPQVLYRQHRANSVGMGRGPVSRLTGRVRRQLSADGPGKHGRQDRELLRLFGADLPSAARRELDDLLCVATSVRSRTAYALAGRGHRQTHGSDFVLKVLQVCARV